MRPVEILLVEDSPSDTELTVEALKEAKVAQSPQHCRGRGGGPPFLGRQGKYTAAPRPDLIMLDLNLPRKDGREVLREIKADHSLQTIPVVVLTTSRADRTSPGLSPPRQLLYYQAGGFRAVPASRPFD